MNEPKGHGTFGFRLIGAMKIASGVMLIAAGLGIFHSLHSDLGETLEYYATRLHLDPDNRVVHKILTDVAGLDPKLLKRIGAAAFIYAVVHFVEGIGLILLKRWAEYLTVVITGSLMPLEIYEIYQKLSAFRVAVFLFNLAIVAYLIFKLRQDHQARKPAPEAAISPP